MQQSETQRSDFPYVTLLNVLHQPLELIDEKALADACPHQWYNQTLCAVNDSVVRLAVVHISTFNGERVSNPTLADV